MDFDFTRYENIKPNPAANGKDQNTIFRNAYPGGIRMPLSVILQTAGSVKMASSMK
jgi:hypothetical protein